MTITDALKVIQAASRDLKPFSVTLACGFTPLHLQTFLTAHLQQRLADRKVAISTGLYGDLPGTLEDIGGISRDGLLIALEWADLDARLGFRSAGAWGREASADIVASASAVLARISAAISAIPAGPRIVLSLPSLPLPPAFHTPGWQASPDELLLEQALLRSASELAQGGRVIVLSRGRLAVDSAPSRRFDLKSDLQTGLPYSKEHAEKLAFHLANALLPTSPKKGIISDLDDTLWSGIAGEAGPNGVSWDLASHAHIHGLFQKLLSSLSEHGTLVGIASKNDPEVVAKVFERPDVLLKSDHVFPIVANWNAKSGNVNRVLEAWNVATDSVIFVDDSPMELAEVAAAHPGIETMLFPKDDPAAFWAMLQKLRDACGKHFISADDTLRLTSIRDNAALRARVDGAKGAPEEFLASTGALITFNFDNASEPRVLELVNKTNQFNLNGRRYSESEWRDLISRQNAIILSVSYEDKFGPLGTISALGGVLRGEVLEVEAWVMSCRAFSRRIEHQVVKLLFETTGVMTIAFEFAPTTRNGPLQEFFAEFLGQRPVAPFHLTRDRYETRCPQLYHNVREIRGVQTRG